MKEELKDMDREEKKLLYTLGNLNEIREAGYITGGFYGLSDKGRKLFNELVESEFEMTQEEIKTTLQRLQMQAQGDLE